jgi:hypothetical protein
MKHGTRENQTLPTYDHSEHWCTSYYKDKIPLKNSCQKHNAEHMSVLTMVPKPSNIIMLQQDKSLPSKTSIFSPSTNKQTPPMQSNLGLTYSMRGSRGSRGSLEPLPMARWTTAPVNEKLAR